MSLASKVAIGVGGRALVSGIGNALSGAYGIVSKTGQAIGAAGKALGSATQNVSNQPSTPTNKIIIANAGMAGSVGKQKVTRGGTLPAPKVVATPQVSTKMPTEALLNTAVKYLSSIDKSLKTQLDFERTSYQEQARAEREAIIESKPTNTFSDMKNRLSGFKSDVKDNAGLAGKVLMGLAGLTAVSALIASAMDQKEINALKENVEQFKKTFGWLADLGSIVGAGGVMGFLFGGKGFVGRLKGGLVGMVATHVVDRLYSTFAGGYKTDENGNPVLDQNGKPVKESKSMSALGYGLSAVAGGIAVKNIAKRLPAAKLAAQKAGTLGRVAGSSSVAGMQAATRKGTSWLATRRGRKFLVILGRKLGKGMVAKIFKYLARIVAGLLATATGVGAIPGILIILANVAFIGWDIVDIASSIWDAFNESSAEDTNATAVPVKPEQDATKVSGAMPTTGVVSKSETGRPEEAQAFFESKGWTKEQAAGIVGNLFVESGLKTDAIGDGGKAYGIAQWHPDRQAKFQEIYGKSIRQSTFNEQLQFVDWELNNTEKRAGGLLRSAASAEDAAAIVDQYYERSSGAARQQRIANASSIIGGNYSNLQGGGGSAGGLGQMASNAISGGLEGMANLFGTLGSSIVKPGVARNFTQSSSNPSEQISNESMKIQNDITFGIKKEKSKDKISMPTIPAGTPRGISPQKSVSNIDPNYQNVDILAKYLAHFRLAA